MFRWSKSGLILGGLLAVLTATVAYAQDFPEQRGIVNDFAGIISSEGEELLSSRLTKMEQETSNEVAVVTIKTLGDESIDTYAVGLFEKWGIGKKSQDNGILFLVALEERKVRIEVGYGLEGVITDGRAGRILDGEVIPNFREGDYEAGIINGVIAIENYLRTGALPPPLKGNPVRDLFAPDWLGIALIGIGIASIYVFGFLARSKSFWVGGVWGAGMGGILGLATGSLLGLILVVLGTAGFGLFLDWVLSHNYKALKAASRPTSWGSSRGGFRGPYGGGFGGFGGGGGFGGFGGGMSGGGGAGRGW